MPGENQEGGRPQEHQNRVGGSNPSGPEPREVASQVADRFRDGYENVKDQASQKLQAAQGSVAENPGSAILIGFGLGFGLGLALTAMLSKPEETWAEKYLPDSVRDLPGRVRKMKVPPSVKNAPEAVQTSYDQIAALLSDLPSQIAKAMPKF